MRQGKSHKPHSKRPKGPIVSENLSSQQKIFDCLLHIQASFIDDKDPSKAFDILLTDILSLTNSAYGFISEYRTPKQEAPYLQSLAISNIAWNDETRRFYEENAPTGLKFKKLRSLYGPPAEKGKLIIANAPMHHPSSGGTPDGHPPLEAFLGIPLKRGRRVVGEIGLANRPGGYDKNLVKQCQPIWDACAQIIEGHRDRIIRKEAERDLITKERQFEAITESANDAIIMTDQTGIVVLWNPAAATIFGYTASEAVGENIVDLIVPRQQVAKAKKKIKTVSKKKAGPIVNPAENIEAVRKGGESIPIEMTLSTVQVDNEWHIVGILRDTTKRQLIETQIQSVSATLRTLSQCNQALVRAPNEKEMTNRICSAILEHGEFSQVWIGSVTNSPLKSFRLLAIWEREYRSDTISSSKPISLPLHGEQKHHQLVRALRQREARLITNPKDMIFARPQSCGAVPSHCGAQLVLKLPSKNLAGLLVIGAEEPTAFGEEQIKLLEELAYDISYGIHTLRARIKHASMEQELYDSIESTRSALLSAIGALAQTIDERDPYTAGHQRRVSELSVRIAEGLGLSEDEIEGVRLGALIHDIGKIAIPAEILTKPRRLDPEEFALVKTHPERGREIISSIDFPWPIADMVHQHHERYDGSGYPQGLKKNQINIGAQIIGIADVVEAMSTHRPYRAALGPDAALVELLTQRGKLFQAKLVDICVDLIKNKKFHFGEQ